MRSTRCLIYLQEEKAAEYFIKSYLCTAYACLLSSSNYQRLTPHSPTIECFISKETNSLACSRSEWGELRNLELKQQLWILSETNWPQYLGRTVRAAQGKRETDECWDEWGSGGGSIAKVGGFTFVCRSCSEAEKKKGKGERQKIPEQVLSKYENLRQVLFYPWPRHWVKRLAMWY